MSTPTYKRTVLLVLTSRTLTSHSSFVVNVTALGVAQAKTLRPSSMPRISLRHSRDISGLRGGVLNMKTAMYVAFQIFCLDAFREAPWASGWCLETERRTYSSSAKLTQSLEPLSHVSWAFCTAQSRGSFRREEDSFGGNVFRSPEGLCWLCSSVRKLVSFQWTASIAVGSQLSLRRFLAILRSNLACHDHMKINA